GRDDHGDSFDGACVDAERPRRIFILAHGDQPGAETGALDEPGDHERYANQRENDPVERRAALKLQRPDAQIEFDQRPDTGSSDRGDARVNAQHFGKREGHQREVRATQAGAENKSAKCTAQCVAGRDAHRKAEPCVDPISHLQDCCDIGARPEEGCMTERILPAVTAENIPALPGQSDHERHDEKIKCDIGMHDQRHRRQDNEYRGDRKKSSHARAQNKPLGRTRSTIIKMRKMPIWPSDSPRKSPDRLSATPISSAPTSAPGTEPMPPSTTIVKATRTKASPTLGLT